MLVRWLFAALHLLGLGVGLGAVWARARALRGPLDIAGLRRVFYADGWWGGAAAIWISTGLVRLLAGFEKSMDYYLHNHVFWGKMTLLLAILVLEVSPIVTLARWRARVRHGETPDTRLRRAHGDHQLCSGCAGRVDGAGRHRDGARHRHGRGELMTDLNRT